MEISKGGNDHEKDFSDFYIPLPLVAFLMGLRVVDMKYEYVEIWTSHALNGWKYLCWIFVVLMGVMIYLLQESSKWEYIYSFPVTKKQIYKECFQQLHISLLLSGVIFGIFFGIACGRQSVWDGTENVIASVAVNLALLLAECIFAEILLLCCKHVYHGVFVAMTGIMILVPLLVSNVGFFLQKLFQISGQNLFYQKIIGRYGEGLRLPVEIDYNKMYETYGDKVKTNQWSLWSDHYLLISVGAVVVLCIGVMIGLYVARKKYIHLDLSREAMFTRLEIGMKFKVAGFLTALIMFHGATNIMICSQQQIVPDLMTIIVSGKEADVNVAITSGQILGFWPGVLR
jgi:ABC-type proline/glycine betaine transport system permease subunit